MTNERKKEIEFLQSEYGLEEPMLSFAIARGIDTKEKAVRFFCPSTELLYNPFLLSGMDACVERIEEAVSEGERIVIYGDYDADGISAAVILYRFLNEVGADCEVFIPEREDGYGLSTQTVRYIAKKFSPNLIITADCGISCHDEIELAKELGMDVIVTDHHNVPETIPECVVVNPKIKGQEYPFSELCGAGVALKVISALADGDIEDYIDIAAIATIADSVPLIDENRIITAAGLEKMNSGKCEYIEVFKNLTGKQQKLKSDDIAFYLAPMINAAGRMNDVMCAVRFLMSEDAEEVAQCGDKLVRYNNERKKQCEFYFRELSQRIETQQKLQSPVLIEVSDAPKGIIGIVAARLTEKYYRPAIVFTKEENMLKGSARSIDGIDIYALIHACEQYTQRYGGHKMAAGLSIEAQNLQEFRRCAVSYMRRFPSEIYQSRVLEDFELDREIPIEQIEKFEPFGCEMQPPTVALRAQQPEVTGFGGNPEYIKVKTPFGCDFTSFHGKDCVDTLKSGVGLQLFGQLSTSGYADRNYLNLRLDGAKIDENSFPTEDVQQVKLLERLFFGTAEPQSLLNESDFLSKLDDGLSSPFGSVIVASTAQDNILYRKSILPKLKNAENILSTQAVSPCFSVPSQNMTLMCPGANIDLSAYRNIFFLSYSYADGYYKRLREKYRLNLYCLNRTFADYIDNISAERETLLQCYKSIAGTTASSFQEWYTLGGAKQKNISLPQFVFAMLVFSELKLILSCGGKLSTAEGKKADLQQSQTIRLYEKIKGRK